MQGLAAAGKGPRGVAAVLYTLWQTSLYLPWLLVEPQDAQSLKGSARGSRQSPPQHSLLPGRAEERPAWLPPGLSC